jgi:DNA polymerase III subunit gamma/tau
MHLALARKYRPQNFLEVIGQDAIVKTIQNAIEHDRLHHAYLFCGVRGVGKTSLARILAKSLNCEKGPTITPCLECSNCQGITLGNSMDVIEIDGASNNLVDDVRELREQVKFLPQTGKYKIFIIDEVHMLSNSAFNALLKTLEEPPAHVKFIFATTEAHKIPLTIISRCQKFDFKKLNTSSLVDHIKNIAGKEGIEMEEAALHLIASCALGSVRDAMSLCDQVIDTNDKKVTEEHVRELLGLADRILVQELFASIVTEDLSQGLQKLKDADERGYDLKLLCENLLMHSRNLILLESTQKMPGDISPTEVDYYKGLQGKLDSSLLLSQYDVLFKGLNELALTEFQKTCFEILLVKLDHIRNMIGLTELVQKITSRSKGAQPATAKQPARQASNPPTQAMPAQAKSAAHATDWYQLVKWITQERPPVGSLLKDLTPIHFDSNKIEVSLARNSSTKSMLIERKPTIESLIEKHFGKKIAFSITDQIEEKKKS